MGHITTLVLIVFVISSSYTNNSHDKLKSDYYQSLTFECANKIEIIVFPARKIELSFKAKTLTTKNGIDSISNFIDCDNPIVEVGKFLALPDGYFSLFNDTTHVRNLYFSIDTNRTFLQIFGRCGGKQLEITKEGDKYLREIYNNKEWLPIINEEKNH